MSFSCNTNDFPRKLTSYADALRHFESRKPWRGDTERPIGTRSHKNKGMRQLDDGSIAFRLYNTDCVTWHPDDTLTIIGYSSSSTTSFISSLVPSLISHCGGGDNGPVLYLHTDRRAGDDWRSYWRDALVIRARKSSGYYGYGVTGVTLKFNARQKRWLPIDPDDLARFTCYRVDRKLGREVSRKYNLPTLTKVMNAALALVRLPEADQFSGVKWNRIMDHLERGEYASAIALFPRSTGYGRGAFGHRPAPKGQVQSGFLRRLRDHVYSSEGVVETYEAAMLTPSQYKRMVSDSNRY